MKNIHEILAAMGIEVPAEKKADLDKELLANYRTLADYEKQANKLRLAEEKVQTIVERVENGTVYTVEGNSGDACRQNSYSIGSSVIYGYGIPAY